MSTSNFTIEQINQRVANSLVSHLGIVFTAIEGHAVTAKMPIDARTQQPFGLLHGGASAALIETLGSVGSLCFVDDPTQQTIVGLSVNASHLRGVKSGYVYGTATPAHLGRRTHVWQVTLVDEAATPICVGRLTVLIVKG